MKLGGIHNPELSIEPLSRPRSLLCDSDRRFDTRTYFHFLLWGTVATAHGLARVCVRFAVFLLLVSDAIAMRVCSTARCTSARVSFSRVGRGAPGLKTRTIPPGRAARYPVIYTALLPRGFLSLLDVTTLGGVRC